MADDLFSQSWNHTPIEKWEKNLKTNTETYWIKKGEAMALRLFKQMSMRVPAYKDFLKRHRVEPEKIKTIKEFKTLPLISKDNYLKKYPLPLLCWDGKLKQVPWTFAATSGTTGESFYFPRSQIQDEQYAITAELYLRNNFSIHKKTTLYINGFALGVWIGGIFTYEAITTIARQKKYALSMINPGLNKTEIFKAVKKLSPLFDQTIIAGYPPFIKDLIDEGPSYGINWKKYHIKFIFSAEGFSENWRNYIIKKAGLKNPYLDSLNHYGTVDMGTMAHETPLSILIRRETLTNKRLHNQLFGNENYLPTLCQYIPAQFYFEDINHHLVCSANSGLPLVRYDLKDVGGIITFKYLNQLSKRIGFHLNKIVKKEKIADTIWHLPFVYVARRADFAVKLQLYDIFPETIHEALFLPKILKKITGKFTLSTKYNKRHNQYLEINIELHKNAKLNRSTNMLIKKRILNALLKKNTGPGNNINAILKQKGLIKIVPRVYKDRMFNNSGIKQKWIQK